MSDPIVTASLAKDWISRLWKLWSTIRSSRAAELLEIQNEFGNPKLLAEFYVEPDCQLTNPADLHEEEAYRRFRQPISHWLNGFLEGEFFERDGRNTLFVLSDAGMGKTSLLMMLKLTHLMGFWPTDLDFKLLRLGPSTLGDLAKISAHNKTVLLLDALDEDPTAWGRIDERLRELLHATKSFRQVILTCRTQFFPRGGQGQVRESPEKIEVAGFVCNLIYLSPFSHQQVERYLGKIYPNSWLDLLNKAVTQKDNRHLNAAREIVLHMQSLRMRPMLLTYIRELMKADVKDWREYSVYEALVRHWLLREQRKKEDGPTQEELWQACTVVARHLQQTGQRSLSVEELRKLLILQPVAKGIQELDVGGRSLLNRKADGSFRFAHYSIQEFLVVHGLITGARPESPLRATDEMVRFIHSWMAESPRERVFPWDGLDPSGLSYEENGMAFVFVPGGEYTLGAEDCGDHAKPVHQVFLKPFWIGKYPVTNAQYQRFLKAHPDHRKPESWDDEGFNQPNQPVVDISWLEASEYCRWAGWDLPSEAQWEAAARGTEGRPFPWGIAEPSADLANFGENVKRTTPVGSFPQGVGPYGTLDQAGNVWEWCRDVYDGQAYENRDGQSDPVVLGDDSDETVLRVVRGGSWGGPPGILHTAFRFGFEARGRDWDLGFRVVCVSVTEHGS